jgi:hypothetical protein
MASLRRRQLMEGTVAAVVPALLPCGVARALCRAGGRRSDQRLLLQY